MNNNNYIETEQKLAISYYNIGNTFYHQGKWQEAINNFNQSLNLSQYLSKNELGMLNFNLGRTLINLGDVLSAITYFEQAIKLIPNLIQAEYHKNTILKGYNFGRDWFSRNLQIWSKYLTKFINQPELNVLEIGSWEGRSTCWLLDNILTHPTAKITCIDTFAGSFEHQDYGKNYLQSIEQKFDFNISITGKGNHVNKIVGESYEKLRSLPFNNYDFIYIDGSHLASDVLEDVILCWRLLKLEGLIIFDDYDFNLAEHEWQNTKVAIDAFLIIFQDKIKILHQSHQVVIEKMKD